MEAVCEIPFLQSFESHHSPSKHLKSIEDYQKKKLYLSQILLYCAAIFGLLT